MPQISFGVEQYPAPDNPVTGPMLDAQLVLLVEVLILAAAVIAKLAEADMPQRVPLRRALHREIVKVIIAPSAAHFDMMLVTAPRRHIVQADWIIQSEERRVGKECR